MFKFYVVVISAAILHNGIASEDKIAELFSQIENNKTHRVQSDIINNDYNSVLCWLETINLVEYRNGTRSIDRQFSIILETPGDLSNTSLDSGEQYTPFNHVTKKSRPLNFTTLYTNKKFTVKVKKNMVCGSGKVMTKEYTHFPSNKQRIQINLGSNKLLEDHLMMKAMKEKYSPKKKSKLANDDEFVVASKRPKEAFKSSREEEDYSIMDDDYEPTCDATHKINIKVQVVVEHRIYNNKDHAKRIKLVDVEKGQDFYLKWDASPKFTVSEDDVNRSWERFVRLLSREYFIDYFNAIIPFSKMPLAEINATLSAGTPLIKFDKRAKEELIRALNTRKECYSLK